MNTVIKKIGDESSSSTTYSYVKSELGDLSLNMIDQGSRIDRLCLEKYIPLREQKLLQRLVRTRAVHDDIRAQIISDSTVSQSTKNDDSSGRAIFVRNLDDSEISSALLGIVNMVDRGTIGTKKLHHCCSCCSCSSKISIHELYFKRKRLKRPYTCGNKSKARGKRRYNKQQALRLKTKLIRSDPCTCTFKLFKKHSKHIKNVHLRPPSLFDLQPTTDEEVKQKRRKINDMVGTPNHNLKQLNVRIKDKISKEITKVKQSQTLLQELPTKISSGGYNQPKDKEVSSNIRRGVKEKIVKKDSQAIAMDHEISFLDKNDSFKKFKTDGRQNQTIEDCKWDSEQECVEDDSFSEKCIFKLKHGRYFNNDVHKGNNYKIKTQGRKAGESLRLINQKNQALKLTKGKIIKTKKPVLLNKQTREINNKSITKYLKNKKIQTLIISDSKTKEISLKHIQSDKKLSGLKMLTDANLGSYQYSSVKYSHKQPLPNKKNKKHLQRQCSKMRFVKLLNNTKTRRQVLKCYYCALKLRVQSFNTKKKGQGTKKFVMIKKSASKVNLHDTDHKRIEDKNMRTKSNYLCQCAPHQYIQSINARKANDIDPNFQVLKTKSTLGFISHNEFDKDRDAYGDQHIKKPSNIKSLTTTKQKSYQKLKLGTEMQMIKKSQFSRIGFSLKRSCDTLKLQIKEIMKNCRKKLVGSTKVDLNTRRSKSELTSSATYPEKIKSMLVQYKLKDKEKEMLTNTQDPERSIENEFIPSSPSIIKSEKAKIGSTFNFNIEINKGKLSTKENKLMYPTKKRINYNKKIKGLNMNKLNVGQAETQVQGAWTHQGYITNSLLKKCIYSLNSQEKKETSVSATQRSKKKIFQTRRVYTVARVMIKDKRNSIKSGNDYQFQPSGRARPHRQTFKNNQKQAVRIGSSFSLDVKFSKNLSTPKNKGSSKYSSHVNHFQKPVKRFSKSNKAQSAFVKTLETGSVTKTNLERCFCTLKLQKRGRFHKQLQNQQTDSPPYFNDNIYVSRGQNTKKVKPPKLPYDVKPYECVPNICIPGQCDPYQCLKIMKNMGYYEVGTSTQQNYITKSTSSLARNNQGKYIHRSQGVSFKPKQYNNPLPNQKSKRKAVRIESNFSFNVEFRKDHQPPSHFDEQRESEIMNIESRDNEYVEPFPHLKKQERNKSERSAFITKCMCFFKKQKRNAAYNTNMSTRTVQTQCKPGICVAGQCDSYICSQIMSKYRKKNFKMSTADHARSKTQSVYVRPHNIEKKNVKTLIKEPDKVNFKQPNFNESARMEEEEEEANTNTYPSHNENAVRISSQFKFDIEFYKNHPAPNYNSQKPNKAIWDTHNHKRIVKTKGIQDTGYKRVAKTNTNTTLSPLFVHQSSQVKKKGKKSYAHDHIGLDKSPAKLKIQSGQLHEFECEPFSCVPGECDPYECLKRIKMRKKNFKTQDTITRFQPRCTRNKGVCVLKNNLDYQTNQTNFIDTDTHGNNGVSNIVEVPRFRGIQDNIRAVRISSNVSFSIEFNKKEIQPQSTTNIQDFDETMKRNRLHDSSANVYKTHLDRETNAHKKSRKKPLKRCFCCLDLKNNYMSPKVPFHQTIKVGRVSVQHNPKAISKNFYYVRPQPLTAKLNKKNIKKNTCLNSRNNCLRLDSEAIFSNDIKTIAPYLAEKQNGTSNTAIFSPHSEFLKNKRTLVKSGKRLTRKRSNISLNDMTTKITNKRKSIKQLIRCCTQILHKNNNKNDELIFSKNENPTKLSQYSSKPKMYEKTFYTNPIVNLLHQSVYMKHESKARSVKLNTAKGKNVCVCIKPTYLGTDLNNNFNINKRTRDLAKLKTMKDRANRNKKQPFPTKVGFLKTANPTTTIDFMREKNNIYTFANSNEKPVKSNQRSKPGKVKLNKEELNKAAGDQYSNKKNQKTEVCGVLKDKKPLFEMQLDSGSYDILNKDQVIDNVIHSNTKCKKKPLIEVQLDSKKFHILNKEEVFDNIIKSNSKKGGFIGSLLEAVGINHKKSCKCQHCGCASRNIGETAKGKRYHSLKSEGRGASMKQEPKSSKLKHKKRKSTKINVVGEDPCNFYMSSLRNQPFPSVYRKFPSFYPHFLSLLHAWKQLTEILMFILAAVVWSPCILCMELCRACMCCFLCTG
ncbi:uncharacterized protein LOC128198284 [Bicyclus anynana]|uniref:Uncharacterized protein LOC128198284 n=1 Tax=Bicyclus anynana TaxID=110368 RepID=A0ABM3LHX5_BICAN|nr:uncharacterized protein LOC128198284 [Bicyclus anynana]